MDLNTFLDHFDTIAEAPSGIAKLKALILDLAVRGKLVPQNSEDEPAELLRNQIIVEKQKLEKSKKIVKQRSVTPVQETELPYAIPNNWSWCRWNDVALHIGDIDHKMPTEVSEGIPYVSPRNFKGANIIDFEGAKKISLEDFERLKIKVQPTKGDIIFPRYGTIGENRLVEVDINFLASYSCAVVKNLHGYIEPKYSYYYSLSKLVKAEIERYTNKTTQANVGIQSIQNFVYPLPPLAEQKRIVEKVDELMALCDRLAAAKQTRDDLRQKLRGSAIAALMNAETDEALEKSWAIVRDNWHTLSQDPKDVDELRRSILQLAVQGKLVLQSPHDEPASILLEQVRSEKALLIDSGKIAKEKLSESLVDVSISSTLPAGWYWTRLGSILTWLRNGIAKPPRSEEGLKVLRISALRPNSVNLHDFRYLDALASTYSEYILEPGDLLFTRYSGNRNFVGICGVVPKYDGEIFHPDKLIRGCLIKTLMVSEYLSLAVNTGFSRAFIEECLKTTAGQVGISGRDLKIVPIPLPPFEEQKRIVAKVDELMQMCDQLEASLRQSQQRASALAASAISHLTI